MALLFAVQIAFPRFRGNPVLCPRGRQKPVSVIYQDVGSSPPRGHRTGFSRKRGNAIWTANSNAICDFRIPPESAETHTFHVKSVYFK